MFASVATLLVSGLLLLQVVRLRREAQQAPAPAAATPDFELAVHMAHLQHYAEKLHWALVAENGPLADFYLHELEETAEAIALAKVTEDGVDITASLNTHLMPAIAGLEKVLKARQWPDATDGYRRLVQSCNNCHVASQHDFIRIQVPTRPTWSNQDFAKP
jgi:hypothetical protein